MSLPSLSQLECSPASESNEYKCVFSALFNGITLEHGDDLTTLVFTSEVINMI